MTNYVCIHGHFYQPPRENPWLEAVEIQDSAYPYHDWNRRITVECYAPNAASRILDNNSRIIDIVSNYSRMSFNFGPTLLSWMEMNEPGTYASIIESDRESKNRFGGHGSAIAQCYNHMIMPLASPEHKRLQIIWGIKDFEKRFSRKPEGMWLPETAVDYETLDIMAGSGILFTILSPHQARRVRKTGSRHWHEIRGVRLDTGMPYRCVLPSGRTIAVFFYNSGISRDIAFGRLLDDGISFADRLTSDFHGGAVSRLMNIATDGETFGHHHRYGEMALSYALYHIEKNNLARITVYGEFLEMYPPDHEVEIVENTSWSCSHGVERWRAHCGCNSGSGNGWTQEWRTTLRGAMDWLRDNLAELYRNRILRYCSDADNAMEQYIDVILNRSRLSVESFLLQITGKELSGDDKIEFIKLLEVERNSMLMYTSCGWFFDDISGIESVQIMLYAARAMQLAEEISGLIFEETFIKLLQNAKSNYYAFTDAADVYRRLVKPVMIDPLRFGAHYAVSSLFRDYVENDSVYCYLVQKRLYERIETGKQKLALGLIHVKSEITLEENDLSFAVLHMGDHNIFGGVRRFMGEEQFSDMSNEITTEFRENDIPGTFRKIENHFASVNYSLWHLFRDEQRDVINRVMASAVLDLERSLRQLNDINLPIIQVIRKTGVPLPGVFSSIMEFILNDDLKKILNADVPDTEGLKRVIEQMRDCGYEPDTAVISYTFTQRINDWMEKYISDPAKPDLLEKLISLMDTMAPLSLKYERWRMQNMYFIIGRTIYTDMKQKAEDGNEEAAVWIRLFDRLGVHLKVKIS